MSRYGSLLNDRLNLIEDKIRDLVSEIEEVKLLSSWDKASPVLHWSHVPDSNGDGGWNLIECHPEHVRQPVLRVMRMVDPEFSARVVITCRDDEGDDEITIADIIVPYRFDLFDCSVCGGIGEYMSLISDCVEETCPWCNGIGRSAMDEAREIASALYWSWLRSPNGGGEKHKE